MRQQQRTWCRDQRHHRVQLRVVEQNALTRLEPRVQLASRLPIRRQPRQRPTLSNRSAQQRGVLGLWM